MSGVEWLVVLGGLGLGYWLVSFFTAARAPVAPAASASMDAKTWHEVLGVSEAASVEEIRAAYKTLMSQYHPDKVAALGEELQALALRKSQEVGAAYREALAARGADA